MSDIPIHNETEYTLTPAMLDQITRDAVEDFGDTIRAIRVQYGIERHAFNPRTGEIRYAFSPRDFGLIDTSVACPDTLSNRDVPSIDDDTDEAIDEPDFDDIVVEVDSPEETSLESLAKDVEDDEDEEVTGFQGLDDAFDDPDEDKDVLYDDDYQ